MIKRILLATVVAGAFAAESGSSTAEAQIGNYQSPRSSSRYQRVPKPTISPYFNLFRNDVAGVPSYYMFLERDRRVQATFRRDESIARDQSLELRGLERRLLQRGPGAMPGEEQGLRMRPTAAGVQPAVPATFNNRSHFYGAGR